MTTIKYVLLGTFLATLLLAVGIVVFGTPGAVISTINEERFIVGQSMGHEALERSINRTNSIYQSFTPAIKASLNFLNNEDKHIEKVSGTNNKSSLHTLRNWYNSVIESFWNLVYQSIQRISIIFELRYIFFLIIIPACVDGFNVRKIKISSFGYQSPLFYQLGFIGITGLIAGLFFLATVPFAIPFEFYTGWMLVTVYFLRSIIANTQKKI